ncbi:MAG: cation acetate symporter [Dehalococcoidales bacterium]|jgi:cation/acetate symporter|nr:cation acetate symporter [Dehalococcoidales bacterium]
MNYRAEPLAIAIFIFFVITVLGLSYFFARRSKSASGYYAAGGKIHWGVNGIAFAGDYLSAASFLGIAGMIAVAGYDGFLYSIGYLAGWIVALFVVAEPLKRLGKYTFADAIDAKFKKRGIVLAAAISTLIVSSFYLIPQMVGAGSLVTPLLGLPFEAGVAIVGFVVIIIVATAGMTSTTWVQFIKGGLLVIFSLVLVIMILFRGISTTPELYHDFKTIGVASITGSNISLKDDSYKVVKLIQAGSNTFVKLSKDNVETLWKLNKSKNVLEETQTITHTTSGAVLYNGAPKEAGKFYLVGQLADIEGNSSVQTGSTNPFTFIETIKEGTVVRWGKQVINDGAESITVYYQIPTSGRDVLIPGLKFKIDPARGATPLDRVNFVSLMIALFLGTAALPHILIRYYTVPTPAYARKSTIVAVAAIGLFYLLTLYLGLGAMTGGSLDITNENMSAPLLAKSFGLGIFAVITAIAFATILGTVSGLIVAASGAVANDLMHKFFKIQMSDKAMVFAGRTTAIIVGIIAMVLGVLFKSMNVSFLVGWAFAIAASANLPAIFAIIFWKKATHQGIAASIIAGLVSSLILILLSQDMFTNVYHLYNVQAPNPIGQPAIISVPVSFIILVVVSLLTQKSPVPATEPVLGKGVAKVPEAD